MRGKWWKYISFQNSHLPDLDGFSFSGFLILGFLIAWLTPLLRPACWPNFITFGLEVDFDLTVFFGRFLSLRWGLQTHLFSKGGRQEFRNIWARFSSIKWGCCDWSNFIWTIILFIKLSRSSRHFLAKFRRQLLLRLGRITCCTYWNFAWKEKPGLINKFKLKITILSKWKSGILKNQFAFSEVSKCSRQITISSLMASLSNS